MNKADVKRIHDLLDKAINDLKSLKEAFTTDIFGEEPCLYWEDVETIFTNLDRKGKEIIGYED